MYCEGEVIKIVISEEVIRHQNSLVASPMFNSQLQPTYIKKATKSLGCNQQLRILTSASFVYHLYLYDYLLLPASCDPGFISTTNTTGFKVCDICPVGTYSDTRNSLQCTQCGELYTTRSDASTRQADCLSKCDLLYL